MIGIKVGYSEFFRTLIYLCSTLSIRVKDDLELGFYIKNLGHNEIKVLKDLAKARSFF